VTRFGGGDVGLRRARAAAMLMLALPGGAYVYQGEELGLPEVRDLPDELRQDPTFARTGGAQRGRDGCRVPIPWSGDTPPFGFGPDAAWLPQPADWAALTVEQQTGDPSSMLSLYREALRIRREHPALGDGTMTWLASSPTVLAFRREPGFVAAVNLGADPAPLPKATEGLPVLLASGPLPDDGPLPGDTAVWFDDRR
jgi:alpha-glucosidase